MELLGYLDPASISVLATSLTALVAAVAASFIIFWRKLKNKFKKKDGAENKDAEADIHVLDESVLEENSEQNAESETQTPDSDGESHDDGETSGDGETIV